MAAKLSEQQIAEELRNLKGWSVLNGNLHRVFEFKDFHPCIRLHDASRSGS